MNLYREIAERALSWILTHLDQFSLPEINHFYFMRRLKPINEIGIAANIIINRLNLPADFKKNGDFLLQQAWEKLHGGELLHELTNKLPSSVTYTIPIYYQFFKNGLRNRVYETTVRRLIKLTSIAATDLSSCQKLELATALKKLDIPCPWDTDLCYQSTWLYAEPEPWIIDIDSAYAMTHIVFYRTQWGENPNGIDHKIRDYLCRWVPVWAMYYYHMRNFDLLAEMVMVLRSIQEPDDQNWAEALKQGQEADGMVPAVCHDFHCILDNTEDPARNKFLDNYHPTLVTLLAAVMSLNETIE